MFAPELSEEIVANPERLRTIVLRDYYGPDVGCETFSRGFFGRHHEVNKRCDEIVPQLPKRPNLLVVGLGECEYGTGTVGSGALELTGALEAQGKDEYTLTLLDLNQSLLEKFLRQSRIIAEKDTKEGNEEAARLYGRRTGGVVTDEGKRLTVPLSPLFQEKLNSGAIRAVQGDLLEVDLKQYGPFDLIQCFNVLTHLDTGEYETTGNPYAPFKYTANDRRVLLALMNLIGALTSGGSLMIDQIEQCGEAYEQWCIPVADIVKRHVSKVYPSRLAWESEKARGLTTDSFVQITRD